MITFEQIQTAAKQAGEALMAANPNFVQQERGITIRNSSSSPNSGKEIVESMLNVFDKRQNTMVPTFVLQCLEATGSGTLCVLYVALVMSFVAENAAAASAAKEIAELERLAGA